MKDKPSKPVFTVDYKVAAPRQFREALLRYRSRKNRINPGISPLRSRHLISLATCPHLVH